MPIQVRCPCGHILTAGADVLGKVVRCAACGRKLAVARSPGITRAATALGDSPRATTGGAPPEDHTPTPGLSGKRDGEVGRLTRKHLLLVGGLNGLGWRETLRWKIGGMDAAMIGLFLAAVAALVVPLLPAR